MDQCMSLHKGSPRLVGLAHPRCMFVNADGQYICHRWATVSVYEENDWHGDYCQMHGEAYIRSMGHGHAHVA